MKQIKLALAATVAGLLVGFLAAPAPVQAQGVWGACDGASDSAICADQSEATDIVKDLINLFLYAIGIVAVIMIVHSGLKYVTSRGDAEQIKSAKNTLLYAVIGLVVAAMAFTIVNFVVGAFGDDSSVSSEKGQSGQSA